MFVTLPIAFAELPGGSLLGGVFFVLVIGAALTSAISLVEPVAAWLVERFGFSRPLAVAMMVGCCWLLGLVTVFSFNVWSEGTVTHTLFGRSPFDVLEFITNILMPLGGLLIALFAGWALTREQVMEQMATNTLWFAIWQFLVRFVAPTAVAFVFVRTIPQVEGNVVPAVIALLLVGAFTVGRTFLVRR
jgi:NSS family neurotransmitter:Na+ symporter